MRSFTFLRLCDSLVEEAHFAEFEKFVRDLGGTSEGGSP
jgi:beta-amylase